jgi:FtsH-binding integral membrane protein
VSKPRRPSGRRAFLRSTYLWLAAALIGLAGLELALMRSGLAETLTRWVPAPWPVFVGIFLVAGWIARDWAYRIRTRAAQIGALALYTVANALFLAPILLAASRHRPEAIAEATSLTVATAVGLSLVAWTSGVDFAFLRSLLMWGGWLALILLLLSWMGEIDLGLGFGVGMMALAGASILYDTSKLMRRRRRRGAPAAALELFASITLFFRYALRSLRWNTRG